MKAFQAASEPLCHRPASYFSFYIRETESALPLWFTPQILCYNPKREPGAQSSSPWIPVAWTPLCCFPATVFAGSWRWWWNPDSLIRHVGTLPGPTCRLFLYLWIKNRSLHFKKGNLLFVSWYLQTRSLTPFFRTSEVLLIRKVGREQREGMGP